MVASSAGDSVDPPRTYWEDFKEWLLPSTSFKNSRTPRADLLYARVLLALFYAALTGLFVYTVVRLCYSGRIELFSNLYKVDFVEAPSLAFCPFNPNQSIEWPDGKENFAVSANKMDLDGEHHLHVKAGNCSFDRACGCVDMSAFHLTDISRETMNPAHGMVSRESIQFKTNLTDSSSEKVIKVGIYDSYDKSPDWFYVDQGTMFLGQLELIIWTVVDVSITGLINTFKGDLRAMVKNRHIFRYTSQSVGAKQHQSTRETTVRYEMKTFFVEETMSSHRAFSLYTVGVILSLVALRYVVVDAFFLAMMPEYKEKNQEIKMRELTPTAVWMRNICLCGMGGDEEQSENDPLLKKGAEA